MKRKLLTLFLTLSLTLSFIPAVQAAEAVTPTPPSWVPEDEYAIFEGSAAYEPDTWDLLLRTRAEVAWGPVNVAALTDQHFHTLPYETSMIINKRKVTEYDFGILLEKALIEDRLLFTRYNETGPYWPSLYYVLDDGGDTKLDGLTDQQRYALLLWTARGVLHRYGVGKELDKYLPYLMNFPQFSLDTLINSVIFTDEEKESYRDELAQHWEAYANHVEIWLDGRQMSLDVSPEIRNGRTMIPIRAVAEAIGADVEWDQETQQVLMNRANVTVIMTVDSTTAMVNGSPIEMDVAPYISNDRTLIPARYMAEFFGQNVDWDAEKRQVKIFEDKSAAAGSNLESWTIDMAMIYGFIFYGSDYGLTVPGAEMIYFGMYRRTPENVQNVRESLASTWGVTCREDILSLVSSMTFHGHNDSFLEAAAIVNSLSDEDLEILISQSSEVDQYMWPYTKEISERWGDTGILAWDLSRMAAMVQWGYTAGYLSYQEALELIEPAAQLTWENFSNWHEFYLNYLDGYNWWARNNIYPVRQADEAEWLETHDDLENYVYWRALPRANYYSSIRSRIISPLKDSLFETGVIGLPEVLPEE